MCDILNKKGFAALPILIFLTAVTIISAGYFMFVDKKSTDKTGDEVACTKEAKICPDGTAVGRTGPNCEFAACPGATSISPSTSLGPIGDIANWQTYRNEEYRFEVKYPLSWGIEIMPSYDIKGQIKVSQNEFWFTDHDLHRLLVLPLGGGAEFTKAGLLKTQKIDFNGTVARRRDFGEASGVYGVIIDQFPNSPTFKILATPINAKEYIEPNKLVEFNQILSTFRFLEPVKADPSTGSGNNGPSASSIELTESYINSKYLFGFKYPEGHIPYIAVDKENGFLLPAGANADRLMLAEDDDQIFSGTPKTLEFNVVQEDVSTENWLAGNLQRYIASSHFVSQKDITFAGKKAVEVLGDGTGGSAYKLIVVKPGNFSIAITQSAKSEFLDAILKTFTFNVQSLR